MEVPQPRLDKSDRFRLVHFRSPLLVESLRSLFLGLLRCFTSPRFAFTDYEFIHEFPLKEGLPHSEICGSKPACGSPQLIAACCVLHRLSVPRHSPAALTSLIEIYCMHAVIHALLIHAQMSKNYGLRRKYFAGNPSWWA
jgi:hypothetical protein